MWDWNEEWFFEIKSVKEVMMWVQFIISVFDVVTLPVRERNS